MSKKPIYHFWLRFNDLISSFSSSVIFYTTIPLPSRWTSNWSRIARWCPLVGLLIGLLLTLIATLLRWCRLPHLTSIVLVVTAWVGITGGLHLDGAMDTADGLGVTKLERRLAVMRDSATGAYGAIAAVIILLLKTAALSEMSLSLWLALPLATGWARFGQVWAIAFYPYLRATGKGSFHQENIRLPQDLLLGLFFLLGTGSLWVILAAWTWQQTVIVTLGNMAIALGTGYWFNKQLGGQTGDTYGAVVEWSEALILCFLTAF